MPSTTSSTVPTIDDAGDHGADLEAIAAVIADVEAGFNGNDPALATRHFAANAREVAVTGAAVAGIDEIVDAHVRGFAGPLRDQHARYEVGDVTFVRPDVALVQKRATATDPAGTPIGVGHQMVALYVMVRERGRWWIVARQNTLVPEG